MLDLAVVGICDAAHRVQVCLDHRRKLWVPSFLESKDAKGDGDRAFKTLESEELCISFCITSEIRFEGCGPASLLAVGSLTEEAVALEEERQLWAVVQEIVHLPRGFAGR
jgi:hypothetical protein